MRLQDIYRIYCRDKEGFRLADNDVPNAVEKLKQPRKHPTAEKVEAIKDALKHFNINAKI